jgi:ABC-type Fe3+-siderophore transport system permease subunit
LKKGGEGGFSTIDFPRNPLGSPFVKGGSQELNLMAVYYILPFSETEINMITPETFQTAQYLGY